MLEKLSKEPQYIGMAREIAHRLISECNPEEQRDFLNTVESMIKTDYEARLKEIDHQRETVASKYSSFTSDKDPEIKERSYIIEERELRGSQKTY